MLKITQTQKRYRTFDGKTAGHLIQIINELPTYNAEHVSTARIMDIFYDDNRQLLKENNLILRKRVTGKTAEIKLKRTVVSPQFVYQDTLRKHERETEVPSASPLSDHYFFLNNALNSMFTTALKFDPDKLFAQMQVTLTIDVNQKKYLIFGPGGFKAEVNGEDLKVSNKLTKRKNKTNFIQIKMTSPENTFAYFEDFIKRIEKRCKEIIPTIESRYDIACSITQPMPTKEELRRMKLAKEAENRVEGDF